MVYYLLGSYFALCYLWGAYLLLRLVLGKRLRRFAMRRPAAVNALPATDHACPAPPYEPTLPKTHAAAA